MCRHDAALLVTSDGWFYILFVLLYQSGSFIKLESLGSELQLKIRLTQPSGIPKVHDLGAARFTEDKRWYRSVALDILVSFEAYTIQYNKFISLPRGLSRANLQIM